VDASGELTIAELKEMKSMGDDVQMPQASMAGIRQQYFTASFSERMPPEQNLADVFKQLDEDSNGVLTRMETKGAARFFKGDL
jgi:Ca2+-binding EF-hand superfamily protein